VLVEVERLNLDSASFHQLAEQGTILSFSMATSFTAAALGAEGVGRATTMVIGNGHMPDMGLTALSVLRDNRNIREIFEQRYGAP
jgi:L-erythro-3,5-diaminohexanoate dehydrogenase